MLYSIVQCSTVLYGTYSTVPSNQLEEGGWLVPIVSSVQKVKMSKGQEVLELPKAKGAQDAGNKGNK